jgi:hypothetical protein
MPVSLINYPIRNALYSDRQLLVKRIHIMENHIVTGIGCFAQPQKLSQLFLRLVHTYTLGQVGATDLAERCKCRKTESNRLIKALIDGQPAGLDAAIGGTAAVHKNQKITGFYLTLKDNCLELSIFASNRTRRQEIHLAVLDRLPPLRQKRLN